jgi:hypothetical protein
MYIAIGPYCWGRGFTLKKAIARAKENWPFVVGPAKATNDKFNVYRTADPDARVNEFGWVISKYPVEQVQKSSIAKENTNEPI